MKKSFIATAFLTAALSLSMLLTPVTGSAAEKKTAKAVKTETVSKDTKKAKRIRKTKKDRYLEFFKSYKAPAGTTVRYYKNDADGKRIGGLVIYKSYKNKHSIIAIGRDGSISAYSIKKENGKYKAYLVYNPLDTDPTKAATGSAIVTTGPSVVTLKPLKFVIHSFTSDTLDDDLLKTDYKNLISSDVFTLGKNSIRKITYKGTKDGELVYLIKYPRPYFGSAFKGMTYDKTSGGLYITRKIYVDKKTKLITRALTENADGSKTYIDYTYDEDYEDFTDTAEPEEIDKEQFIRESSDMLYVFSFGTVGERSGIGPIPIRIKPVPDFVDQIFQIDKELK